MVANTICCCAPVYRTILPKIPLVQKLKSKVSLLYGSGIDKSKKSDNMLSRTVVTIGGTVRKPNAADQEWIQLNGASNQELTWSDAENGREVKIVTKSQNVPQMEFNREHEGRGVRVQKTFEVV